MNFWKITERLWLYSFHSEVSTCSETVPEENRRCKADNIQQHSLLWTANMDTTTFVNTIQRVKDSVSKVLEKLGVMLASELKPSFSSLSMQLVMSQGKVHDRLSCCKKVSWSYYEKPLQKEKIFCLLTIRGCILRSLHWQFRRICTKNLPPSFRPNLSTGCCRNNRHEWGREILCN